MPEIANLPCCVCGSSRSAELLTTSFARFGYPADFHLRRCEGCDLIFNSPRRSPDELRELYTGEYYFFNRPVGPELERAVAGYRRTIRLLPDAVGREVLEVGPGRGYLLALLRELGWRTVGVELSGAAAEFARERFDLDVLTGTIDDFLDARPEEFPVVLAQDVIEHVPDPLAFAKALRRSTREGGFVVIDTPNGGTPNIGLQGASWRGFNPFHIYLFNAANLRTLLERAGFEVERIGSYNNVQPGGADAEGEPPPRGAARVARGLQRRAGAALARVESGLAGRRVAGVDTDAWIARQHVKRAARQARRAAPLPLDPRSLGDNLVCVARAR